LWSVGTKDTNLNVPALAILGKKVDLISIQLEQPKEFFKVVTRFVN